MKLSHIWKAWISTLIGVLIGVLTAAAELYVAGTFTWKTLIIGVLPATVAAVTDLLREVQKEFAEDAEAKEPEVSEAPEAPAS